MTGVLLCAVRWVLGYVHGGIMVAYTACFLFCLEEGTYDTELSDARARRWFPWLY